MTSQPNFFTEGSGVDVDDAFKRIVAWAKRARNESGSKGHIADMTSFELFDIPVDFQPDQKSASKRAYAYADQLIESGFKGAKDMAYAVHIAESSTWLFFGWVSE